MAATVSRTEESSVGATSDNKRQFGPSTTVSAPEDQAQSTETREPIAQLDVEEPSEDDIQYPTGPQLWLNIVTILLVSFIHGLDLTIVAVTVPALTDHFYTVFDIGWYSAVYGLVFSAMNFFFGKVYTLFDLKKVYIISVALFELGSILCTFAPTSHVFILGRAIAGLGASGQGLGGMTYIPRAFPRHKRPVVSGLFGFAQSLGLVSAPIIGGALIDAFTWRACFGINVPIGALAIVIAAIWMKDTYPNKDLALPLSEKLKRIDPLGTLLVLPAVICLMIGLLWGGTTYPWNDWRIILLFVLFVVLATVFGYIQYQQGDKAIVPIRILKNRTVLASSLYACCTNGILAVTEYYIAIYFQGVRGFSARKSGLLGLPMIVGLSVTMILAAFGTTWIGYYTPFLYATSVFAPIASGLLTTLDLNDSPAKVAALLGFLGVAVGFGIQQPFTATMTAISPKDFSIAVGVLGLGSGIGSSLFIAASATLFQERLRAEVTNNAPGANVTALETHGLSDLRKAIGSDRLNDVLLGYNEAVVQTLYLPLALGLLTIVASAFTEIKSVKKKKD